MLKIITSFALLFFLPFIANSAPFVSNVSGNISNGQTITITGTGFGATGPNIAIYDEFESGTVNANVSTVLDSATVHEWSEISTDGCRSFYTNTQHHSGTKSLTQLWGAGECSPNIIKTFTDSQDVFFSMWLYVPVGGEIPFIWKIWVVYDYPWVNSVVGTNSYESTLMGDTLPVIAGDYFIIGPSGWYDGGAPQSIDLFAGPFGSGYGYLDMNFGEWHRVDYYIKIANSGGQLRGWQTTTSGARSGHRLYSSYDGDTQRSSDHLSALQIPALANGNVTSDSFYDDVYVATGLGAQARVEIGNNATYANCTNLAIITPTIWGDTSITATVRSGSFGATDSAWLFVIDSTGTPSSGHPITFGSSSDATAPTVTIITPNSIINQDTLNVSGTTYDAVGATSCKWRIGSAPDATHGTDCGNTTWTCTGTNGYQVGSNTLYIGCGDAAGNWGSNSITVTYFPVKFGVKLK